MEHNSGQSLSLVPHHTTKLFYELSALKDIILTVSSSLDLDTVLERIVETIASSVGADGSVIYLYDEESEEILLYAATKGKAYAFRGDYRLKMGEGVTGYVASIGSEQLGFLHCYRYIRNRFTKEEKTILQMIANQVALFIKNMLFYKKK